MNIIENGIIIGIFGQVPPGSTLLQSSKFPKQHPLVCENQDLALEIILVGDKDRSLLTNLKCLFPEDLMQI